MASELVNSATNDKLTEVDWTKNIEICELVASDQRQARDVIKVIKKRLGSKSPNTQLYAVMLLEMLMNNIGDNVHRLVIDTGIIPILVKIVKKKSDLPVRERTFLLLDATQTSVGGASGKFPQYYKAYFELVSTGVKFPERPQVAQPSLPTSQRSEVKNRTNGEPALSRDEAVMHVPEARNVSESSMLQKAGNSLEVLKEVLDAVDPQHPEGVRDEFTLDLVEQCSFQKQRVMHLVMASQDENIVSRAIELNDQLQRVLEKHDSLLSFRPASNTNHINHEDAEEEEEEQLFRRLRKGKACARPEDDEPAVGQPNMGILGSSCARERRNLPLIRPLPLELNSHTASNVQPDREREQVGAPRVAIPPPPAKHVERERYFQANKTNLAGHMRGLSLHSRNASSSHSESFDSSD